jgi:hypothetical protein
MKVGKYRAKAGDVAGGVCKPLGYWQIRLDQRTYLGHRLAWLHVHGRWPVGVIDHINGDRGDNRLSNLREVSQRTNTENQRKVIRGTASGLLGVYPYGNQGRFTSKIKVGRENIHIGCFDTAEEAHEAYLTAKRQLHAGCTL